MNNLYLINSNPSKHILFYINIIILISIIIFISFKVNVYDTYKTYSIKYCDNKCYLELTLDYEKINILDKNPLIEINKKKYRIEKIEYLEPYLNNNISMQDIKLYIKDDDISNKITEVKIKYNKQRIIDKIKYQIVERE